jgi:hypothetical protein
MEKVFRDVVERGERGLIEWRDQQFEESLTIEFKQKEFNSRATGVHLNPYPAWLK